MLFPFQRTNCGGSSGREGAVLVVVETGVDNGKADVAAVAVAAAVVVVAAVEQVHHYR